MSCLRRGVRLNSIKDQIMANKFVDEIIIFMSFNKDEYENLICFLSQLVRYMKFNDSIDKELALYLYTIPQAIRNVYLKIVDVDIPVVLQLEDAWVELDALVIDCLS